MVLGLRSNDADDASKQKTLRAVDLLAEGFVALSLEIQEGYARRSRLALGQNLSPHSSVISAIKH